MDQGNRKVVWIVGMSYSGSSLLNLLLDTQPTVRGMGEGAQAWRKYDFGGPCAVCKTPVAECQLYRQYRPGDSLYAFNFAHYPDAQVLVDSSKHACWLVEKPYEDSYQHFCLLLSKSPHAEAYSLLQHHRWDYWTRNREDSTVLKCFSRYVRAHRTFLDALQNAPQLAANGLRAIHYLDFVRRPQQTVRELCEWLQIPFSDRRLQGDGWRLTDTHVLGGNPALVAQISQDNDLAYVISPDQYMDGKYASVDGQLFVDDLWRSDIPFLRQLDQAYVEYEDDLGHLLPLLGHSSVDELRNEIAVELEEIQIPGRTTPDSSVVSARCPSLDGPMGVPQ